MDTVAMTAPRRTACVPYSVRLDDERESRMEEMREAGLTPTDILQRGFDLAWGEWNNSHCRE